jgi:hypothetical protein
LVSCINLSETPLGRVIRKCASTSPSLLQPLAKVNDEVSVPWNLTKPLSSAASGLSPNLVHTSQYSTSCLKSGSYSCSDRVVKTGSYVILNLRISYDVSILTSQVCENLKPRSI